MTTPTASEIERVADSLERDEYEGDDEVLAIKCMRELAALLRAAEGDEPERDGWERAVPLVSAEYADHWKAKALLALAENERLKAQLVKPSDAESLLRELVTALSGAFISSWQSTAAWSKQLEAAEQWISDRDAARAKR